MRGKIFQVIGLDFHYCAVFGGGNHLRVAGEPAALDFRLMRHICRAARFLVFIGYAHIYGRIRDIDIDDIALFNQSDFAAASRFGPLYQAGKCVMTAGISKKSLKCGEICVRLLLYEKKCVNLQSQNACWPIRLSVRTQDFHS